MSGRIQGHMCHLFPYISLGMMEYCVPCLISDMNQHGTNGVHCDSGWLLCLLICILCSSSPFFSNNEWTVVLELCGTWALEHSVELLCKGVRSCCNKYSPPTSSLPPVLQPVSLSESSLLLSIISSDICLGVSSITLHFLCSLTLLCIHGSKTLSFHLPYCVYELHKWLREVKWHL